MDNIEELEPKEVWSQNELLHLIGGLCTVYWNMPWIFRLFYGPYKTALTAMYVIISGEKILDKIDKKDTLDSIEGFLSGKKGDV